MIIIKPEDMRKSVIAEVIYENDIKMKNLKKMKAQSLWSRKIHKVKLT